MTDEHPNTTHGRLLESTHIAGYSVERAMSELEWLLDEDRWKTVGKGYDDINAFLATLDLSGFRILANQRKKIAKRLKQIEASNRAAGNLLGVSHVTIMNDTSPGKDLPPPDELSNEIGIEAPLSGKNLPPWHRSQSADIANVAEKGIADVALTDDDILAKAKDIRLERAADKRAGQDGLVAAFSEDGPFGTVVIDPPWKVQKIDRDVRPNQDAFDYPVMSRDEIEAFFIGEVVPKLEPDCHLFMWTTQKWLPTAIEMLAPLGFSYVLTMVWHKSGGFQPVGLPQYNCEFAVYARKGSPIFIDTKDFPCCFDGERREHSRKPDRFYDIIRRVTGGSRIDVFSREAREGFAQYGNEIGKFVEAEYA